MRLVIQTDSGQELQEFTLPKERGITTEESHTMGERIAKSIMELSVELEKWERKLFEHCDCFAKKHAKDGRLASGHCHSSECASWEMTNE